MQDLTPRIKGTGDEHHLQLFEQYFKPQSIVNGATMISLWDGRPLKISHLLYLQHTHCTPTCAGHT